LGAPLLKLVDNPEIKTGVTEAQGCYFVIPKSVQGLHFIWKRGWITHTATERILSNFKQEELSQEDSEALNKLRKNNYTRYNRLFHI
jgi:hypothetical protein